jgi:DNA-binding transcriptional LysR family regulator
VDIQELPSLRIVQALGQGSADLGIVSTAVATADLQTRPFRDDPLVLIMAPDHPLADSDQPDFARSLEHGYVGLGASSALALHLEEQALHLGRRMQVRVRAEGFDGVIRMVAHGAGLGIVPLAAVQRAGPQAFKTLPMNEGWARRKLLLCARDFAALPPYATALLQALALP